MKHNGAVGYSRLIAADNNRLVQGCGSLLGIATGLLADRQLNDAEIRFLQDWLSAHDSISTQWPGDVVYARVKQMLADGVVTEVERQHLVETLEQLCGGTLDHLTSQAGVNQLAFDNPAHITFPGSNFCVTGDFVYGPRERVCGEICSRGGHVLNGITKKLNYLIVGVRGSDEWKHGSYGTKIVKAVEYKRAGLRLFIVREDSWSAALATR